VKSLSEKVGDAWHGLISGNEPDTGTLIPELGKGLVVCLKLSNAYDALDGERRCGETR
jgi:hypothetical protein